MALEFLRARNPFPGTTGRICTHPCETECNRRHWDEAIAIRDLERSISDLADRSRVRKPLRLQLTGRRIGVIGGGPAGLTFSYFSRLLGHEVTLFEAAPLLGGIPRLCVPGFRLPKTVLDLEIGLVLETGIDARTDTRVGRDIQFNEIRDSFDAILIATGTWKERELPVPNVEKAMGGVQFLRQTNIGMIRDVGRRVVIMGGGGVAFDCAITAKRLGADEVRIVCLEGEDCMVAPPDDLAEAKRQGITVHNRCMASSVLASGGRAVGLECFEISGFSFDAAGEARIETKSDQKKTFSADTVIFAVGVKPELSFLEGTGIEVNPNGTITVDAETHATSLPGVFAAGDVATGSSIAARAIGQGRRAALAVNRFLLGYPKEEQVLTIGDDLQIRSEQIGCPGDAHVVAFNEILDPDYYEKTGRDKRPDIEAGRCFHCGHCSKCGKCVEDCPGLILAMTESGPEVRYADECWHCGNCRISCPDSAVSYEFPLYTFV